LGEILTELRKFEIMNIINELMFWVFITICGIFAVAFTALLIGCVLKESDDFAENMIKLTRFIKSKL